MDSIKNKKTIPKMDSIKKTSNKKALSKFRLSGDVLSEMCLYRWLDDNEQPGTDYQVIYSTRARRTTGFALLRRCDVDPLGTQEHPWLLELLYVCPIVRRQGIGSMILRAVIENYPELTAVLSTEISEHVFTKNGFIRHDPVYRYP